MAKKANGLKPGRPRLSVSEKTKKGSANPHREKKYKEKEMKVVALAEYPTPPADLGEEGKKHWDIVVRILQDMRVITPLDFFNLRALCIEWECYLDHRKKQIASVDGSYYKVSGKNGDSFQPHPIHYNGTNHLNNYIRLCNEFGLSPASRARIGITAQENTKTKAASLLKNAV